MRAEAARSAPHGMRLAGRLALGAALATALAAPFLGVLLLVEGRYEGLEELDRGVADSLNSGPLQHPGLVDLLTFLQAALSPNTFRLPSAHALGSFLGTGLLLLVALPVLSGPARSVAVGVVTIPSFNRIALGGGRRS